MLMVATPSGSSSLTPLSTVKQWKSSGTLLVVYLVRRGPIPDRCQKCFSSPVYPCRLWGPPNLRYVPAGFYPGIRRLEREARYSPPCSAEVKNEWNCTSTPSHVSWRVQESIYLLPGSTLRPNGREPFPHAACILAAIASPYLRCNLNLAVFKAANLSPPLCHRSSAAPGRLTAD
jgi:hypothetical protein